MERLFSVKDLMDRYQCSRQTAVRHIKRMEHMEKPLMVRQSVLEADELERTVKPAAVIREELMRAKLMRRMA